MNPIAIVPKISFKPALPTVKLVYESDRSRAKNFIQTHPPY
jgi:hypothetical protein